MNIWHISDTHCLHNQLLIPSNVDLVIHSGDATNTNNIQKNGVELVNFIKWFDQLKIKHKVFVPGNHDVSLQSKSFLDTIFDETDIIVLNHESCIIKGLNIFGSPYTPSFGKGWAFNIDRSTIYKKWQNIPENTDILITHGPPKYILDQNDDLENVGCLALYKAINIIEPRLHCFGHVHSNRELINNGIRTLSTLPNTLFSNAACLVDGKNDQLMFNGNQLTFNI
jgi:Icc-related predicted phosphoesterase